MTAVAPSRAGTEPGPDPRRLRWWREVAYVIAFYIVYSFVRNQFG